MNERILELAVEANNQTGNEFDLNHKPLDTFLEKFAELIVKECAGIAECFHRHQYDFTGNLELHEFIKKHFGVK